MTIGERIRYFRLRRGITQKTLGLAVGFPETSASVRIAQYETGTRKPRTDLTIEFAQALGVAPQALSTVNPDCQIELMHNLFILEDIYSLNIYKADEKVFLKMNGDKNTEFLSALNAWYEQAEKYRSGKINKEQYDQWRYNYGCKETDREIHFTTESQGTDKAV